MLGTVILVVLVLALIGVIPVWSHSANWGYAPFGGLGVVLLVLVILLLTGRI
jgi:Na+/phosphate symporter